MDRATNLLRRIVVFGVVAVAFLAILVLRPSRTVAVPEEAKLAPTFAPLDVAKVRAVEIERPGKDGAPPRKLRLVRANATTWQVESAADYPADTKKVEDFLRSLASVRTHGTPTTNPDKFAPFAGADGWTDVRVYEDGDAPALSFGIGKSGAEGSWSSVYLRVDEPAKRPLPSAEPTGAAAKPAGRIVTVTGVDAYGDRTDVVTWVETRVFPGLSESDVVDLEWAHAPKGWSAHLVRGKKGEKETEDPWTLEGEGGGKAKASEAKLRVQQFTGLLLQGVEGKGASDAAKWGFDKPDLVVTATGRPPKEGELAPTWRVVLGRKVEGKAAWYAKREGPAGSDPFVLTIGESETSWFRQDPKDLLETPPAPPPAAAGMDGAGMGETPGMGEAPAMGEPPAMGEAPGKTEPPAMGEAPGTAGPPAKGDAAGMSEAPVPPGDAAGPGGKAPAPAPSR